MTRNDVESELDDSLLLNELGEVRMEILRLASLAPNGHNTQPWQVLIHDKNNWSILSDQSRWLPAVDPMNHDILLSIGAFLENLTQAASFYGLEARAAIVGKTYGDRELVQVSLKPSLQKSKHDLERITSRRTVRKGIQSKEITGADWQKLTMGISESFSYHAPRSEQAKILVDGTRETNRLQTYRDNAQEELADWIRWSNKDVKSNRDGLTPASMDIKGIAGLFVRNFYDRSSVMKPDFRKVTLEKVEEQITSNGGWILLLGEGDDVAALIESGRHLQKMWLRARDLNIAIHPMTQILQEGDWKANLNKRLEQDKKIQLVLRTGYVEEYPKPVSLRRPVSWFAKKI